LKPRHFFRGQKETAALIFQNHRLCLILENERKNPTCQRFFSFPALADISISFVLLRYYQVNIKSSILKL